MTSFRNILTIQKLNLWLSEALFATSFLSAAWWFTGQGLFYSDHSPVLSPFTSLSLMGFTWVQIADRRFGTWGKPMSLAVLGIVACGNASNIVMQWLVPSLVLETFPQIVATSIWTSVGLILFCIYEVLILVRKTPSSFFILDDVLLHLALFPGALSLMGHLLGNPIYYSSSIDPRVGIGFFEMGLMATLAVSATLKNQDLFLWTFLSEKATHRWVFALLFLNQYIAPILVGGLSHTPSGSSGYGLEFFVMLAGVSATLFFLFVQAYQRWPVGHFDRMAKQWDSDDKISMMKTLATKVKSQLPVRHELDILDFGTGTGLFGLEFLENARRLVGVDTSKAMLEAFRAKTQFLSHVSSQCVDIEKGQSPEGSFDLILSSMAFHHLEDPEKALKTLKEHLKPGGQIAIVDLEPEEGDFHSNPKEMGVKHFGFSRQDILRWAERNGMTASISTIHELSKNGKTYKQFLATFS